MYHRPRKAFIHILNGDLLLNIFHLCRPVLLDEEADDDCIFEAKKWDHECWWYKLAHVCQKWRYLVIASASQLRLCLVCTYATPVADMLAHSPPLPLIIDYVDQDPSHEVTVEDEEGILLALQHRHRVRCIRLCVPALNLQKLVVAIYGEFPMLEYLYINPLALDGKSLILPETFRALHLRQVTLRNVTYSPSMSHIPPDTPCIQAAERIDRSISSLESQQWRYAPFCYGCLLGKCDPHATDYQVHLSTFSTMIPFSTFFISIDQFSWTKMKIAKGVSYKGDNGTVNAGGTSSHTFAEGGGTLYSHHHLI